MRMMMHVTFPHETFNAAVKDGSVGAKMKQIHEQLKPEAAYYTAWGGRRSEFLIVDLADPSKIPFFAEPWFLLFNGRRVLPGDERSGPCGRGAGGSWQNLGVSRRWVYHRESSKGGFDGS